MNFEWDKNKNSSNIKKHGQILTMRKMFFWIKNIKLFQVIKKIAMKNVGQ